MNKYFLIIFLFSMPFFFLGLSCVTSPFLSFFSFLFTPFFFSFFLLELRCFSSFSGVGHFSFFILRGAEFVLLVFGLFSLFLIFFFSFRCWTFLLFHSEGCRICSSCFRPLFLVSYFLGPCVFSLPLYFDRLNKPLRNRFLIVLTCFSDRLRGIMVTQS